MSATLRSAALAAACTGLLTAALPAHAVDSSGNVICQDSTALTTGNVSAGGVNYYANRCFGPLDGVTGADQEADVSAGFGDMFIWAGKSDDNMSAGDPSQYGPFSSNPAGLTSGTLSFDVAQKGRFVIAVQAVLSGPDSNYSYYLFDGGTDGVSSLSFDTKGLYQTLNYTPGAGVVQPSSPPLTFAGLYVLAAVPEPTSLLLMATGLAALALTRRRAG